MTSVAIPPFLVFGHRGAPRLARENTLRSVEHALDAGADGVEVDARCLVDHAQVLYHDPCVEGRRIENHTLGEMQAFEPTVALLADVLALCDARECLLIIEVKEEGWETALAGVVGSRTNVIISSFRSAVLHKLRVIEGVGVLGLITDDDIAPALATVEELQLEFLFPSVRLVDDSLVRVASNFGARVVPWTANRDVDWKRMQTLGCAGVITDVPDVAVAWRKRLR